MAFKQVQSLEAENTIALGGFNKKTRKENATSVEGYYLGSRTVPDSKKISGQSFIHFFQTESGNLGVWGKTDIDRKLSAVTPGTMTRVSFTGMRETPKGDMYLFKVEVDAENTIEVSAPQNHNVASVSANDDAGEVTYTDEEEAGLEDDETALDEVKVAPARRPTTVAAPSTEAQSRTRALLANRNRAS